LFSGLGRRRYDLIVTNPPYVDARAMRALPREYRYEPRRALAGGRDGLVLVRRILHQAHRHLAPGGLLVCEIGRGRKLLERNYPRTQFVWPADQVFVLSREDLPRA
jgi:ribosomal protein L3 glutamine methyltransferase